MNIMNKDNEQQIKALDEFTRLTNYISAAQIFLRRNHFLEEPLKAEHIKPNLLGHWGTCPGINFVYAHINRLIVKNQKHDFMIVVGPGHGFPAFQAGLFVEGSLSEVNKEIPYTKKGFGEMIRRFSIPYGFPSHLNPEAPGVILEGGELGYSLSVSAGAVFDNPNLIIGCIIGDGEAETGSLASSWHINKFISPKTDGAVLPILHLNGYKISGPTILGRMSDEDLKKHFESLGYEPMFIEADTTKDFHTQGIDIFDRAYKKIEDIQVKIREQNQFDGMEKWPLIIMRTPKGLTAPEYVGDKKISGNHYSHQVVFDNLPNSKEEINQLEEWLKSYQIEELVSFNKDGELIVSESIKSLIPSKERSIGLSKYAHGGQSKKAVFPSFDEIYVEQDHVKSSGDNSMKEAGKYMKQLIELGNEFRLFSPDETYSNKLDDVFDVTKRVWQLPIKEFDKDLARSGRVVEMLSEHVLFGMMWGYSLTGRHAYFVSYEAFAQIVSSMADQYIKFIKIARTVPFRKPVPSANVILTSLLERQDHNGFSHQNPSFIASHIDHGLDITYVYFPADKNLMKLAMEKTIQSYNKFNIIVCGKKMSRTWLSKDDAKKQANDGIMIWDDYSQDDPDVVIVTAGDYVTEEAIAGMKLIREKIPHIKIRFINIFDLNVFDEGDPRFTHDEILDLFFTRDKGIVFNFHGYPDTIKKLLFDLYISDRIIINGYMENGSTTSSFDMKARNGLSRFHLLADVSTLACKFGDVSLGVCNSMVEYAQELLAWEKRCIIEDAVDPESIRDWDKK